MLDSKFTLLSISTSVQPTLLRKEQGLVLKSCNVCVYGENSADHMYSQLDELTFEDLNRNDYGCGYMEICFGFLGQVVEKPYPVFFANCFAIRTDTDCMIKPKNSRTGECQSKINHNGETVVGVRYFFKDAKEIERFCACNELLAEGLIALDTPKNVFGLMCRLKKEEDKWALFESYTYQCKHIKNIKDVAE